MSNCSFSCVNSLTYLESVKFLSSASIKLLTSSSMFFAPVALSIFSNDSWYSLKVSSGIIEETLSLFRPQNAFWVYFFKFNSSSYFVSLYNLSKSCCSYSFCFIKSFIYFSFSILELTKAICWSNYIFSSSAYFINSVSSFVACSLSTFALLAILTILSISFFFVSKSSLNFT